MDQSAFEPAEAGRKTSRHAAATASPSISAAANFQIHPYPEATVNEAQAKEFHEQFKITYTAFVGLCAIAHLLVFANNPWF